MNNGGGKYELRKAGVTFKERLASLTTHCVIQVFFSCGGDKKNREKKVWNAIFGKLLACDYDWKKKRFIFNLILINSKDLTTTELCDSILLVFHYIVIPPGKKR